MADMYRVSNFNRIFTSISCSLKRQAENTYKAKTQWNATETKEMQTYVHTNFLSQKLRLNS